MHAVTQQAAYQAGLIDDLSTGPAGEFATEDTTENGWHDSPVAAWASPAHRLDETPGAPIEFRPNGEHAPYEHYRHRDSGARELESVTYLDADGFEVDVRINPGEKRWVDNPRSVPAPEARLTQRMSPSRWRFTRPFGFGTGAHRLNGNHFSMADHRRDYEVGGMIPQSSRRNTYRLTPSPWDANNIDMPVEVEPDVPNARVMVVDLPPADNRSWRL